MHVKWSSDTGWARACLYDPPRQLCYLAGSSHDDAFLRISLSCEDSLKSNLLDEHETGSRGLLV